MTEDTDVHILHAQKPAFVASPAKLLQLQAQDAAERAAQRQQKQQQVLLLQQALIKQEHAAGMFCMYYSC